MFAEVEIAHPFVNGLMQLGMLTTGVQTPALIVLRVGGPPFCRSESLLCTFGKPRVVAEVDADVAHLSDDFGGQLAVVALLDRGETFGIRHGEATELPELAPAL